MFTVLTLSGSVALESISESSKLLGGGDVECLFAKLKENRLLVELRDDVRSRSDPVLRRSALPTDPSLCRFSLLVEAFRIRASALM